LNFFISDIQPFTGLLFIINILPRIPSGAINLKSLPAAGRPSGFQKTFDYLNYPFGYFVVNQSEN
jgi:hypothetical protein